MKFPVTPGIMSNKWYLIPICLLVLAITWPLITHSAKEPPSPVQAPRAANDPPAPETILKQENPAARIKTEDKVRSEIERQQALIEAEPAAPEAPAYLNSTGNLYRQKLRDYKSAAEAYQRIILDYPKWEGVYAVYPQLEVCYQELDDMESLRWLYQLMMQRYPPEAEEHKYAQEQLKQR